jgi:glycerol-3-phosphate cytidylyltransferase
LLIGFQKKEINIETNKTKEAIIRNYRLLGGINMKKVITYGTFDLLHWGHINLLKRAKQLGDHLTVAISSDEFNAIKNKKSYHSFENRKMILESIRYVDEVIAEDDWEQKITDVVEKDIDIFVMGDDWKGKFDFLKDYCEVVYLPRTIGISTTKIKEDLLEVKNG